jgi:hypothetical protein
LYNLVFMSSWLVILSIYLNTNWNGDSLHKLICQFLSYKADHAFRILGSFLMFYPTIRCESVKINIRYVYDKKTFRCAWEIPFVEWHFIYSFTPLFSWLRHYSTSRNVASSNPDEVIKFFNCSNPFSRIMALGSTQPLTEMSTRNLPGR